MHNQKGIFAEEITKYYELVMQPKISSFFRSSSSSLLSPPRSTDQLLASGEKGDAPASSGRKEHEIVDTDRREAPESVRVLSECQRSEHTMESRISTQKERISEDLSLKPQLTAEGRTLNKKRSYAQFHLDCGQSDFNLHKCSICEFLYAPGDEYDEKNHKTYHKEYTCGIRFKGWRNERVVHMPGVEGGRIVCVLECDSLAQRKKVQEVVKMMETELVDGWIFHKLCKVYLFISSQRVAGCVVAEPIKEAFKIIPRAVDKLSGGFVAKKERLNSTTLQFGSIIFQREVNKRAPSIDGLKSLADAPNGAIVCETEAIGATCGIRAIWVTSSNRRKGIASQLLEAVRRNFSMGFVLEKTQLAFSQPTSAGVALASKYFGTPSFLVYRTDRIDSRIQ